MTDTNTRAIIAETDCWMAVTKQEATYHPGAAVIEIDFSNMPLKKIAKLSEVGGRAPGDPADWMLTEVRLINALRDVIGPEICPVVSQTNKDFVISAEVYPMFAAEAMLTIGGFLEKFGLNSGISHP